MSGTEGMEMHFSLIWRIAGMHAARRGNPRHLWAQNFCLASLLRLQWYWEGDCAAHPTLPEIEVQGIWPNIVTADTAIVFIHPTWP